jgi:tetratricopeptide (TPR) repeat protein
MPLPIGELLYLALQERDRRNFSRAGELLLEAMHLYSDRPEPFNEYGWLALKQNDFAAAEQRFTVLRERFPDLAVGYRSSAALFSAMIQLDRADAMLKAGIDAIPDDVGLRLAYAHQANATRPKANQEGFSEVDRRFRDLLDRFPDHQLSHIDFIRILRHAEAPDRAAELANIALERWPDSPELLVEAIGCSFERQDWMRAVDLARSSVERLPGVVALHLALASGLARMGDISAAEKIYEQTVEQFPDDSKVAGEYANLANERADWVTAVTRWKQACSRFPNNTEFARRLGDSDSLQLENTNSEAANTDRAIISRFESLGGGDRQGCEFGFVQRNLGAEPIGLLRWTSIEADRLALALEERFVAFGSEETTALANWQFDLRNEFNVTDTRYGTMSHTFAYEGQIDREKFLIQTRKRMRYLARKLVQDLENGEKIFVYRLVSRDLAPTELDRFEAALRQYGKPTLMCVNYANEESAHGSISRYSPHVIVASIDRFQFDRKGNRLGPANESWLTVCRNAFDFLKQDDRQLESSHLGD